MKGFVVDAMLGRLATWLRLVGCDTYYSTKTDDDNLLRIAHEENRALLTADEELSKRAQENGTEFMLVRGTVDERVASVFMRYGINAVADPSISRCTKCNGTLVHISAEEKDRIRALVYDQTFNHYDEFWLCEYCSSVFFRGGQWKNIEKYMARIADLISGD